jgi:hypothetical protein
MRVRWAIMPLLRGYSDALKLAIFAKQKTKNAASVRAFVKGYSFS